MKNKQIDILLPRAMELVDGYLKENGMVSKEYESATASFGGAIFQSGPLPACALYLKSPEGKIDKSTLVFLMMMLVKKQGGFDSVEINAPSNDHGVRKEWMKQVIDEFYKGEDIFRHRLINATIALKLAMRTFTLRKEQS